MKYPTLLLIALSTSVMTRAQEGHKRCGTKSPSRHAMARDQGRMQFLKKTNYQFHDGSRKVIGESCDELCDQCIEIPTYFHFLGFSLDNGITKIIPHPYESLEALANGESRSMNDFTSYPDMLLMVDEQMDVLNTHFRGTPFRFKLMDRNKTTLSTEVEWADAIYDYAADMSAKLGRGGLETLNVYLSYAIKSERVEDFPDTVVAFANFPSYQFDRAGDGVFLRYDCLPNGGLEGVDTGLTLLHEVGHWLGLLHVFENALEYEDEDADPCHPDNVNDYVDDTPQMAGPTQDSGVDCSIYLEVGASLPDTCPNLDGADPVFNFMNYLENETCLLAAGEFTCGQIERMYHQWLLYREEVEMCDEDEIMFELIVTFDKLFHGVENSFTLKQSDGTVIFDSERDHEDEMVVSLQDALTVDLCIPEDDLYVFTFNDDFGDGLTEGSIEIVLHGSARCRIRGNFGKETEIEFSETDMKCPGEATGSFPPGTNSSWPDYPGYTRPSKSPHKRTTGISSSIFLAASLWWFLF